MAAVTVITPDLPHPPTGGGKIKSHLLIRALIAAHDVSLVTVLKGDDADHRAGITDALALRAVVAEPLDRGRGVVNLAKSVIARKTLNEYRTWSPELAARSLPLLEAADVIVADHLETMQYVPERLWPRVVHHTHNAEHMLWRRYSEVADSLQVKLGTRFESRRIATRELRYGNGAAALLAAPDDQAAFEALGVTDTTFFRTLHIGDDATASLPDVQWADTEPLVFFLGTLTWEANADGLNWFLDEVWPTIADARPDARFVIGGKNPPADLLERVAAADRVEAVGFVEDPEEWLARARVVVAPLRFGSGMKLKVVEALMRGVPCVTTTVGAESIDATDGVELAVADRPGDNAARVLALLEDQAQWTAMRDAARALARATYTWDAVGADLLAAVDHVLDRR